METSTKIAGKQLLLNVGEVNYWADAISVVLDNEAEFVEDFHARPIFAPVRWFMDATAIQSTDEDSLWTFLFEHANESVDFVYAPHGNEEPTPAQPHFVGTLVVPNPPRLGGEAGEDVVYTFESRLPIIDGPHRVTA